MRVAFAWTTKWIDFVTREEAERYVKKNSQRGWQFEPVDNTLYGSHPYTTPDNYVYYNGIDYTVRVCQPVKGYNPGW